MNLYLLERTSEIDWDTYDSFVWCAKTPQDAMTQSALKYHDDTWSNWVSESDMLCKLIGKAIPTIPEGEVLGSFNAG